MKYLKWVLLAILDLLFTAQCYITNPIVLLFATECGELPTFLRWWANWDDGLDVEWMITEHHVPAWAEYDFCRHYKYYSEWEAEEITGRHCGFVVLLDDNFTLKERLQRYVCRLCWLYRNTGYGFSYYVTGVDVRKADIVKVRDNPDDIFYETDYAWVLKYDRPSFHGWHWEIFLGWKMQNVEHDVERCMLAFRVNPFCS